MAVQKRSNGFVSRTVVPPDLRPLIRRREIVRSLGTGNSRDARQRAVRFEGRVSALFLRLRQDGAAMDHNQIDALVHQYLADAVRDIDERLAAAHWKVARGEANCRDGDYDWNEFAQSVLAERGVDLQDALAYNRLKETLPEAERLLTGAPQEVIHLLARRLLEAKYEVNLAEFRALRGEPLPRIAATTTVPAVAPTDSPLLSAMVADYVEFKRAGRKWTRRTELQLRNLFRVMTEIIGDEPVRDVTKEDMRELYRLLPQMPAHATRRYPGLTAADVIAAADADGQDERLSPKSQNDYFTQIKSLWKWAVENDYIDKSPAVVLKAVDETAAWDQRPAFTDDQLVEYFNVLSSHEDPTTLWVPLLMLYAGLRTEEAAKLVPEDVREEQGVYVVDINRNHGRLKTRNADRLVPIHSAILPALLKYTEGRPVGVNLWGLKPNANGVHSAYLSKRLNAILDQGRPENDRLVTYSLRHTFASCPSGFLHERLRCLSYF